MSEFPKALLDYFSLMPWMSVPAEPVEGYHWLDEKGNFTDDRDKMVRIIAARVPQTKFAESDSEFEFLFQRFKQKAKMSDEPAEMQLVAEAMIAETNRLIDLHKNFGGATDWNFKLIANAQKFIRFLTVVKCPRQEIVLQEISGMEDGSGHESLLDLKNNNAVLERLKRSFDEKRSNVASLGMDEKEFIVAEIERIRTLFLPPMQVTYGNPVIASWSNDKFRKLAYDVLIQGRNYPIRQILDNAEKEYCNTMPQITENNLVTNRMSIRSILIEGVAYVLYEQFLKDQLAPRQKSTSVDPTTKLADLFGNADQYKTIEELLVRQGLIHPVTLAWNAEAGSKSMAVAILKELKTKRYYKPEVKLTPALLQLIALNTFDLQISADTTKSRTKGKKHDLDFIKPAP